MKLHVNDDQTNAHFSFCHSWCKATTYAWPLLHPPPPVSQPPINIPENRPELAGRGKRCRLRCYCPNIHTPCPNQRTLTCPFKMWSEYWNNRQWSVCGWKRGLRRWVYNGRFASQMRIYFTNDCQFSCLFFLPPDPNCMLRKFNHQIFLHTTFVRRGWGVGWWWWMEEVKEGWGRSSAQC